MEWFTAIVAALLLVLSVAEPGVAQPSPGDGYRNTRPHRARTRVLVRPLYPYRRYHSLYPPPYDIEYPGPNAHRECTGGFATEYRAGGTVIVPRLHCQWVPGRYAGP